MLPLVVSLLLLCHWGLTDNAQVPTKMVDMTHAFDNTTIYYPILRKFETETVVDGRQDEGYWLFFENIYSGTHTGTHMDAPAHFTKDGLTIDQIPLSNFFAPAAVIDITWKAQVIQDAEVEVWDLLNWEYQTGLSLNGHVVLMCSGWSKRWGDRTAYLGTSTNDPRLLHFPGIAPKAAQWLVDNRQVLGVGVDSVSVDKGQGYNDHYPTHRILLPTGIFILENVANVEQLPISGANLIMFPMKIGGGSGAPCRIIALLPVSS